jgi:rhamnosyltransferase
MPDISLILNEQNRGVAAGLNQGIRFISDAGLEWALLLDQDSSPTAEMFHELCAGYARLRSPDQTALLAPRITDADSGRVSPFLTSWWGPFFRRVICRAATLEDISTAITSGALLRIQAFNELEGFREDLFIDYVDTEFCLRLQTKDWQLAAVCSANLEHKLGARSQVNFGPIHFHPTHHLPWRWYTIARNRVQMLKSYATRFPHWLSYELTASLFITLRMLLTEKHRLTKLRAVVRGTWDGLRGRMGPPDFN